jgi:hypothetical protein
MTICDQLAAPVEFAREAMTFRLGYEVELAALEPVNRDGKENFIVFWRRKSVPLRVVA